MNPVTGIVVYLCIWWVVVFCTLPLWIQRDDSDDPEIGPGVPKDPKIKQKFILTSIISALIWIVTYICIEMKIIDFRALADFMIREDYQ